MSERIILTLAGFHRVACSCTIALSLPLAMVGSVWITNSAVCAADDEPGAASTAGSSQTPATQDEPSSAADAPPASEPSGADEPETTPPSLDDLLGIPAEEKDPNAQDAASQDQSEELKRKLNEVELADAFEVAIAKMSLSAELLEKKFDPGLGTQRVQEDIIAKLSQLLDQARKQKGKSSSSSSSSSQQQQQQSNPSNRNQQGKQQNKAQDQQNSNQRNQNPTNSQEGDPPPMQEGDINRVIEETRTEWGGLPQRVRDMLLQGRKERPSRLYEQLTSEYYKRLAEDNAP